MWTWPSDFGAGGWGRGGAPPAAFVPADLSNHRGALARGLFVGVHLVFELVLFDESQIEQRLPPHAHGRHLPLTLLAESTSPSTGTSPRTRPGRRPNIASPTRTSVAPSS